MLLNPADNTDGAISLHQTMWLPYTGSGGHCVEQMSYVWLGELFRPTTEVAPGRASGVGLGVLPSALRRRSRKVRHSGGGSSWRRAGVARGVVSVGDDVPTAD